MRVFDTYYFNIIDKVSFKETKPYLERMLSEQGFSYKNISFMLYDLKKETAEKVLAKLPALKRYEFMENGSGFEDIGLTSIRENWKNGEVHAAKEDWEDISTVFSKIPRPYNFPSGHLILDGINWFEDSDESVAIESWGLDHMRFPTLSYPPFKSNRIMQKRFYDDGRKHNGVSVTIEVTGKEGILDSVPIIQKLVPYLGEDYSWQRECVFDRQEYQELKSLEEKHSKKIERIGDSSLPESTGRSSGDGDSYTAIPHVADKFTLNKAFKGSRFERIKGQPNWLHLYSYRDTNGFTYDAYTQKISYSNEFRCWIKIGGFNFNIEYRHEDYVVGKEGESLEILKKFVRFCDKMVDEYSEELKHDFGITPEWYV